MRQLTETSQKTPIVLRVGFWLTEGFDFYALSAALEQLRLAKETAVYSACEWQILSLEGQPLKASNGIATATVQLSRAQPLDVLILCGGDNLHRVGNDEALRQQVQHWASQPIALGALGRAGQPPIKLSDLDDLRCSVTGHGSLLSCAHFNVLMPMATLFRIGNQRLAYGDCQEIQRLMRALLFGTYPLHKNAPSSSFH
ncbi:hypothetical protein G7009_04365 [Pseudomonas capeferrum]|uniref:hypothetical protein n=1 Tax=Pseudomonas capeferrum TaxID=1495066 RepID=UPI0015E2C355|nr:hypothetical protein [Pseudomonas capeferrum]MBA1201016.1 hypothetical protein [Pseudomonas capeferrum]